MRPVCSWCVVWWGITWGHVSKQPTHRLGIKYKAVPQWWHSVMRHIIQSSEHGTPPPNQVNNLYSIIIKICSQQRVGNERARTVVMVWRDGRKTEPGKTTRDVN